MSYKEWAHRGNFIEQKVFLYRDGSYSIGRLQSKEYGKHVISFILGPTPGEFSKFEMMGHLKELCGAPVFDFLHQYAENLDIPNLRMVAGVIRKTSTDWARDYTRARKRYLQEFGHSLSKGSEE